MRSWRKGKKNPAYMENAQKESMSIWRMGIKNLCLQGECADRIYVYKENAGKESMCTLRKRKIININIHILTSDAKFNCV